MPRIAFSRTPRLLGLCLLITLGACAQQREPGYYDTPRGSTLSDAMHRAQGGNDTVAPSQLQLDFGDKTQQPVGPEGNAAASDSATGQPGAADGMPASSTSPATVGARPAVLADTHTYLGTIACMDGGQCPPTRMTLTLAPDGQWRARNTPVDGSGPDRTMLGCWYLTGMDPVRIVLQTGDQARATLEFQQSTVLRLTRINGQVPLLESRLTRQADVDPIKELATHTAQTCTQG